MTAKDQTRSAPAWWSAELTERERVLLHVQPLLDERRSQAWLAPEVQHYDSLAVALRILEMVLEASGLDDAVTAASVSAALSPALAAMDRAAGLAPSAERHAQVVERVLGALRNDAEGRRPFQLPYTTMAPDGQAVVRQLEFKLLVEAYHADGTIVLRTTTEGANLYLRALALDLESQQAAAEAIVELQLKRGRFQDAVDVARQAQRQSLRYGELLRDRLEQTRRNLASVDWRQELPALLADARIHLETRFEVEDRLLAAADARLQALEPGTENAEQVGRVRHLLSDCRVRHQELHRLVLGGLQTFLAEQARQAFLPQLLVPRPTLGPEVLERVLAAPAATVVDLCLRAQTLLAPPEPPGLLWLSELLEWQLQVRRPPAGPTTELDLRDLVPVAEEAHYFPPDLVAQGDALLRGIRVPRALSDLLCDPDVGDAPRALRDYLVLRALQAAAPEPPQAEEGDYHMTPLALRATAAGPLDLAEFGGDDLLLTPEHAGPR